MLSKIQIVRTISELRNKISYWRKNGLSIGLVPTMGALHDGHFSLVKRSINSTDKTIATLFVNPKQFGQNGDLTIYPRDEFGDIAALDAQGVDLLFIPSLDEMYPTNFVTEISVPVIGDVLEGIFRPGFFVGVATVVAKLLIQSLPDKAFFWGKRSTAALRCEKNGNRFRYTRGDYWLSDYSGAGWFGSVLSKRLLEFR